MALAMRSAGGVCRRAVVVPGVQAQQRRYLDLHEGQALQVFQSFQVATPRFAMAKSVAEAKKLATDEFNGKPVVVKAQVLAGGRGLGHFKENKFQGGVHICDDAAKVEEVASKMLGNTLVTKQTGEAGKPCNMVLLSEKFEIASEKYFAILMDRASGGPLMIGSKVGGTSIEDIAHADPSAIVKVPVDITQGLSDATARKMAEQMGWSGKQAENATAVITGLYRTFIGKDCTMLEINPMAELKDGRVIVCDAKVNFDDNAAFRQEDIHSLRDTSQEDAREVEAAKWDLNYIGLDGNIACMVNGAGLAMATMDLLSLCGGSPANFLDVGGSANKDQVTAAFRILDADPRVKALLINICGGIMRCDVIAEGVVAACRELQVKKPIVLRLVGTNVQRGKEIIEQSGLALHCIDDLNLAALKAVELSKSA